VIEGLTQMPREQYVSTFDSSSMAAHGDATGGSPGGARATLGVIPNYSEEEADQPKGVRISGTGPGSPAEKAGLKDGDVIIHLGDTKIDNLMDLTEALRKGKPGDKVKLVYLRGEEKVETETTLAERKG
jgi:S1-C subfamily serine protease